MKFVSLKLNNSALLHGTELTFIQSVRHKCQMELQDSHILVTTDAETIIIPLSNVVFAKVDLEVPAKRPYTKATPNL